MTKRELDSYISINYEFLNNIAKGLSYKNQRDYDPSILIHEAYEHCLKIIEQITTQDQLQRYLIAKINLESRFTNSKINIEQRVKDSEQIQEVEYECHLEVKQQQEEKYNRIETYYNNEKDSVSKYFFEAYYKKGHNSIRKLATYFSISPGTADKELTKIKQRIHETI